MSNDINDFMKVGNDILNSVTSAIDRNDYSSLHDDVSKAIKSVSVERKVNYASKARTGANSTVTAQAKPFPFFQKKISKYLGLPQMVFAGCAEFLFLPLFLGTLLIIGEEPMAALVTGLITAGFGWMFFSGLKKFNLARKYHLYGNILRDAEYFSIKDLAKVAVKGDKEVLSDIKAMIKNGFLPRAKLDTTETTCMITDRAYEQYLGALQDYDARQQREEAQKKSKEAGTKKTNPEYEGLPPKVREILEEGRDYIVFVRQINDIIPDTEEMSNKLYRLEDIMNRIFAQVRKDPESADELHKLMNYYLPTTKKLLTAYVELDKQPDVGDNIIQTKKEIDAAMDTINEAFEKLLDSLFQDMAWDISSDINVMKTMMAQDGLTLEGQGVSAQMQAQAQSQGQTQTQLEFK